MGSVGAGKSSLISALLGEMRKVEGKVVVNVSVLFYIYIYIDSKYPSHVKLKSRIAISVHSKVRSR